MSRMSSLSLSCSLSLSPPSLSLSPLSPSLVFNGFSHKKFRNVYVYVPSVAYRCHILPASRSFLQCNNLTLSLHLLVEIPNSEICCQVFVSYHAAAVFLSCTLCLAVKHNNGVFCGTHFFLWCNRPARPSCLFVQVYRPHTIRHTHTHSNPRYLQTGVRRPMS